MKPATSIGSSRSELSAKVKRTRRSPVSSTRATRDQVARALGEPFALSVSQLKITSATATGVPSEKAASGCRVKATQPRSSGMSMVSASRP